MRPSQPTCRLLPTHSRATLTTHPTVSWPRSQPSSPVRGRWGPLVSTQRPGGRAICPPSVWPQPSLGSLSLTGLQASSCPRAFALAETTAWLSLLPDAVRLPHLLQAFVLSASSHRGRPRQPAAFAGWPLLRGAVSVHSMPPPVRSGRLSSTRWKWRARPRARARSSCCPWVTHMVGSQLAEAGPSV